MKNRRHFDFDYIPITLAALLVIGACTNEDEYAGESMMTSQEPVALIPGVEKNDDYLVTTNLMPSAPVHQPMVRKVPQLFRSDHYFYVNKMGNCPGNFMTTISVEGLVVDTLEECLKRCSQLPDCKSVAVRMRDLPYIMDSGAQSADTVSRCWLKTLDSCPKSFVAVGQNIEATMLVKTAQKLMRAEVTYKSRNPWQNSTANCTIDGLPPPIPTSISIELNDEDSETPIWLGPLNITRLNATAYLVMADVPGLAGGTTRRLSCFAANPSGASVRHVEEIRALELPKFRSLKLFFDESTNTSARIRWNRWNATVDPGEPPVVGYKIFVEPLANDQLVVTQPSMYVTEELMNTTFQAVIDERTCGSRTSCQFRLLDLEPQSRYLIGVMPMRPGVGGDNGTISWSLNPLVTLCGQPGRIETLTAAIRWRRGMPLIVVSFEAPRRSAYCPEPGEFVVTYDEVEVGAGSERSFKVPGLRRQTEISDVRAEMNYTIAAWYRNTEGEESTPIRISIWTGLPIKLGVKSTTSRSVTLEWSVAPSPSEFPTSFRIAYWRGSSKMPTTFDIEDGAVSGSLMKFIPIDVNAACRRGATSMECVKTVTELRPNSMQYFALLALNGATDEMYRSDTLTVTTSCDVPLSPRNLTVARQSKSAITLQWEVEPDQACPTDLIQLEVSTQLVRTLINLTNPNARFYDISIAELTAWLPDVKFAFVRVRVANTRSLWSEWSDPTEIYVPVPTVPPAPPILRPQVTRQPYSPPTPEKPTPVIARSSATMLTSGLPLLPVTQQTEAPQMASTMSELLDTTEPPSLPYTTSIYWYPPSSVSTAFSVWSRITSIRPLPFPKYPSTISSTTTPKLLSSTPSAASSDAKEPDDKADDDKLISTQTMIIGIVVGCGCVASALAVLCILLFKKKKIFSRNKVSRFSNSPSSGASDGMAPPVSCHDYFIKAGVLHTPISQPPVYLPSSVLNAGSGGVPLNQHLLPDGVNAFTMTTQQQQQLQQQQQDRPPQLSLMNVSGFQTPPTDNTSPASGTPPCGVDQTLNNNNNNNNNQESSLSRNGTLPSISQGILPPIINKAWPSPALISAGSAINGTSACTAVRIDRLKQAIFERRADDMALFRKEFASLMRKFEKPQDIGRSKLNAVRNRYKDVFPYDYNCVLLDDESNAKEPLYVNASYIKGASGEREYVAAQGPCSATVGEFWQMIWQLNINRIVMLTNAHEKGKVKCYKYWPDVQETSVFDGISIETLNEVRYAYYVRRTLRMRMRQMHGDRTAETCSRVITQFQFTNWPDHRVVRFATPVITFLRKLNKHISSNRISAASEASDVSNKQFSPNSSLVLVHCSAGVGRTGTLIAADIAIKKAENSLTKHSPHDVEVDLRSIINSLREQRPKMVQNLEQYMFVYDVVYEALSCFNVKPTAMPLSMGPSVTLERLQREYDTLERTKPTIPRQEFEIAMDFKNAGKNRIQRILPASFCRVQMVTPSDDKQDYFSAIWLEGYQRPRAFIAAQSPMPHTVSDFWSVVWDWNVAAIVSLDPQPCLDPTYCPIGPSEEAEAVYHGAFKIKSLRRTAVSSRSNEESSRPYVVDVLSITNSQKKSDSAREVRHFGYTGAWLPNVRGIPASVEQFAEFIIGIDEARRAAQGRPVIVHCLDAATRTGLTVLSIMLKEQCDCDDEVDVFTVLKSIRNFRPEFIPNFEQYSFAYSFVGHVLGSECSS